jgi:hypothetical protein
MSASPPAVEIDRFCRAVLEGTYISPPKTESKPRPSDAKGPVRRLVGSNFVRTVSEEGERVEGVDLILEPGGEGGGGGRFSLWGAKAWTWWHQA